VRSVDDLDAAISQAIRRSDAETLLQISREASVLDDPLAPAIAAVAEAGRCAIAGRYAEAVTSYRQALSIFDEQQDLQRHAATTGNIGNALVFMGDYKQARVELSKAVAAYAVLDDRMGMARNTGSLASICNRTGEYAEALRLYHQALDIQSSLGNTSDEAHLLGNIANVYTTLGEYPSALEHYERAAQLHLDMGDLSAHATVIGNIGILYASIGDMTNGSAYLLQALEHHTASMYQIGISQTALNVGQLYLSMDEPASAVPHFKTVYAISSQLGNQQSIAAALGLLVDSYCKLDMLTEARQALAELEEMRIDEPDVVILRHQMKAQLQLIDHDVDGAAASLELALDRAKALNAPGILAEIHRYARDLAQRRNDLAGYITHNNEYQRLTDELRGQSATKRLTMIEAEKKIKAERAEKERHKALLYNTLPPSIADRVLRGEVVNDAMDRAAVMFIDMVGFTSMSSSMDPNDVVQLLNSIFSSFDAIIAEHGLMKIKTIGDSYMAVAFPNSEQRVANSEQRVANSEQRVASAAKGILHMVTSQHPQIKVRIGIHCGPLTAGVIGTERLQYDVWGDTVNVASRMESTGEPGRIHVSEAFARQLTIDPLTAASLTLSPRGMVEVKGKGAMQTYWLEL
jgi:adenylate cyclase